MLGTGRGGMVRKGPMREFLWGDRTLLYVAVVWLHESTRDKIEKNVYTHTHKQVYEGLLVILMSVS